MIVQVDPDRPLTDDGKNGVERIADHLQKLGISVVAVCHSGKTRARQTAEIFAARLCVVACVKDCACMGPEDDVAQFAASLDDNTMYVGHLPHMERLVSHLVAGDVAARVVHFENGGVVCIGAPCVIPARSLVDLSYNISSWN